MSQDMTLEDLLAVPEEVLGSVQVRLRVVLVRTNMKLSDISKLRIGQEFAVPRRIDEPVRIMVDDREIARGELVTVDDGLGVSITEIVKDKPVISA